MIPQLGFTAIVLAGSLMATTGVQADDEPVVEGRQRKQVITFLRPADSPSAIGIAGEDIPPSQIDPFFSGQFDSDLSPSAPNAEPDADQLPRAPDVQQPSLGMFPKSLHVSVLDVVNPKFGSESYTEFRRPVAEGVEQITVQPPDTRFHWRTATGESLLFTGIMHTYNLATEAGTRDTLNGHWFQDYLRSVRELRGWSDSDKFMSPYVGHTIEGSVFGYIERQNDPKYRRVQWGDGRDYFVSLLRSMAYSAVWHTQWKIGPISEASLGNVMLHASPGFITLTDTPTLGTCAMMAEDAADRYLIMGLENRTANPYVIMLARSFLNPGRSFANMMAFQVPWHREMRIGLFNRNYLIRQEMVREFREKNGEKPFEFVRRSSSADASDSEAYPLEASIELMAFPYYENLMKGSTCVGGGGSGAARASATLQVVFELSGCLVMHLPAANQSADSLFYGGGLRWGPRADHRISPYIQLLVGGTRVTHEIDNIPLREKLLLEWNDGNGTIPHYPKRSDWSIEDSRNGPSVAVGGGIDMVISRPFAWRLINLEYTHSWMSGVDMISPQNRLQVSTGAILRIGTW